MHKKAGFHLAAVILILLTVLVCLRAKTDPYAVYLPRKAIGPVFYALMLFFAVVILVSYIVRAGRRHIWVLLSLVSVCIVNTGYLALSLSGNIAEALLANRIAYFGNVYMLLFLIITLANACGVALGREQIGLLFILSTLMFFLAATQGYLDLFYRNASFAIVDGYARILKDYGPMHRVYTVYILLYLGIIVGIILYTLRKKKTFSKTYCGLIGLIGTVNVAIWLTEKLLPPSVEYLALSYVLNELLLLWIYRKLLESGALDSYVVTVKIHTDEEAAKTVDFIMENRNSAEMLSQSGETELEHLSSGALFRLIESLPAESRLTEREKEVTMLLLQNLKRKDMASSLCVSEETIKTHTAHIYGKLHVKSRSSLREMAKEQLAVNTEQKKKETPEA